MTDIKITFKCCVKGEELQFRTLEDVKDSSYYMELQAHLSEFDKRIKLAAIRQLITNEIGEDNGKNIEIQCSSSERRREPFNTE